MLLPLSTYPVRTPNNAIAAALAIAHMFGSELTAAICHVEFPDVSDRLVSMLTDIEQVIAKARRDAEIAAADIKRQLSDASSNSYPAVNVISCSSPAVGMVSQLMGRARLSDLVIMPMSEEPAQRDLAQDLIFASGRPVLLIPDTVAPEITLAVVVIAWDGSRVAARAVADSLPFLRFAKSVRLVELTGDKPLEGASRVEALLHHLSTHDIAAFAETVPADGHSAGHALAAYCSRYHADLLVMGAYGHSRIRDFVLGGATKHFVTDPPLPLLLSH